MALAMAAIAQLAQSAGRDERGTRLADDRHDARRGAEPKSGGWRG